MEYDAVVLVEPGDLTEATRSGVRTLYVALSRATQRLTTVDLHRPPTLALRRRDGRPRTWTETGMAIGPSRQLHT